MAARTRQVKVLLLDDRIDILNKSAVEGSPAKRILKAASGILALVRDKMVADEDSVRLSEYCFNLCGVLESATQGKDADDLSESDRVVLEDLERVMCEFERTLRRGVSLPRIKYNKGKVEEYKREIQEILSALNAPSSSPDKNMGMGEHASLLASVTCNDATRSGLEACQRLIGREFALHELPSLIEVIFSSKDGSEMIRRLSEGDAQNFVDVVDWALDRPNLPQRTRKKCLKLLYRTCGRHALLPKAMAIPTCYDRTGIAMYRGGYADVWKGSYCGRDVAVKVIRTYSDSDLQKIVGRFCKEVVTWKTLQHPNVLPLIGVTMSENQFAMISDWMGNGNINNFVKVHPHANRLELLVGVTRGLIYLHSQGMIHGDLKGANILINQTGNACLADFGLLTIVSDPTNLLPSSSCTHGGTVRWMSPERISPERFGLRNNCPTKSSDCYSLGMVIYEIFSGNMPFHKHMDIVVSLKVVEGERPPRGTRFTEGLWRMLELCWTFQPKHRPNIEDVLHYLETAPEVPELLSLGLDEGTEEEGDFEHSDDHSSLTSHYNSDQETNQNTPPIIGYNPLPFTPSPQGLLVSPGKEQDRPISAPPHGLPTYHMPPGGTLEFLQQLNALGYLPDVALPSGKPVNKANPVTTAPLAVKPEFMGTKVVEHSGKEREIGGDSTYPPPGYGSTSNRDLNSKGHMQSRNEEMPFEYIWAGCEEQPNAANNYKYGHLQLTDPLYKCEGCNQSFQRMDALNQHEREQVCQRALGLQTSSVNSL